MMVNGKMAGPMALVKFMGGMVFIIKGLLFKELLLFKREFSSIQMGHTTREHLRTTLFGALANLFTNPMALLMQVSGKKINQMGAD